jgi:GNAT superfamily N-acetyltransferase
MPEPGDGRATVIAAHTPMEDLCGYVWYNRELLEDGVTLLTLDSLHVLEEYRGIGVGTALLETALQRMLREREPGMFIMVRLPGLDQTIRRVLTRYDLEPRSQEWVGPVTPAE